MTFVGQIIGHLGGLPCGDIQQEQVPLVAAVGGEGDLLPIRADGGMAVIPITVGQAGEGKRPGRVLPSMGAGNVTGSGC